MNAIGLGSIAGVPIGVTPWFLVLVAWIFLPQAMAYGGPFGGFLLADNLAWFLTIVGSLLVHEFGHALMAKRYRLHPSVILHVFGGLCAHDDASSDAEEARVLLAGPAAGLLLGAVAYGAQQAIGAPSPRGPGSPTGLYFAQKLVSSLVWFNVFWNVVNLLPIWPLDGGRLSRLGLLRVMRGAQAERCVHRSRSPCWASRASMACRASASSGCCSPASDLGEHEGAAGRGVVRACSLPGALCARAAREGA